MGGGVALLDFDNDGDLDIFFTNGARLDDPMPPGKKPDKATPAISTACTAMTAVEVHRRHREGRLVRRWVGVRYGRCGRGL
jgi:hypothetical protein